jgi:hypothetical protein
VTAAVTLALGTSLLALDGRLGPLSFELRRAIALIVISSFAAASIGGPLNLRRVGAMAGVVASMALVARAPSVPVALVGFFLALVGTLACSRPYHQRFRSPDGLIQACLTYLLSRLTVDLVPSLGRIVGWHAYVFVSM